MYFENIISSHEIFCELFICIQMQISGNIEVEYDKDVGWKEELPNYKLDEI